TGTPCVDLPDLTATTGFLAATPRAIRENLRGFPIDSKYSKTTSVSSSSDQYCNKSLPETSARLPADTKLLRPKPRRPTDSRDRKSTRLNSSHVSISYAVF